MLRRRAGMNLVRKYKMTPERRRPCCIMNRRAENAAGFAMENRYRNGRYEALTH